MKRYIEVDELKKRAYPFPCAIGVEYAVSIRQIDETPTADVAEVKRGKWVYKHEHATYSCHSIRIVCNICRTAFARLGGVNFKFCPDCGAKMDGKEG